VNGFRLSPAAPLVITPIVPTARVVKNAVHQPSLLSHGLLKNFVSLLIP